MQRIVRLHGRSTYTKEGEKNETFISHSIKLERNSNSPIGDLNQGTKSSEENLREEKGYVQIPAQSHKVAANRDISANQTHSTFLRSKRRSKEREREK